MQSSSVLSLSPSFNSYSSCNLAEIAARVVEEFRAESESHIDDDDDHVFGFKNEESFQEKPQIINQHEEVKQKKEEDDEDDFEFAFVCREPNSSPISADDIFYNGQIRPVFPIFNRDLLLAHEISVPPKPPPTPIRVPLRKLFFEERETPSCSSSESDELDLIPPGTYCVWTPKTTAASAGKCNKSNSTGSSKRWKFRDLLRRSNSEGKETFVFFTPSNSNARKRGEKVEKAKTEASSKVAGEWKAKGAAAATDGGVSATAHYARNRPMKEGDRRRSFLPYRQDLVGFFANVNGMSRNIHPF